MKISIQKIQLILTLYLTVFITGCASFAAPTVDKGYKLNEAKKAYVVKHAKSKRATVSSVVLALKEHGVNTTSGSMEEKPGDVDFYVTYVDRWVWDVGMYLSFLEITFIDNKNGKNLASGIFNNTGFFHSFPNSRIVAKQIIDSIYESSK